MSMSMEVWIPKCSSPVSMKAWLPTNEPDIPIDHTTTPPRSSSQRVNFDSRGSKSVTSPRTKAYSKPGIQGKPSKKRKSIENDELTKTMKEIVGIYKESFEERKILEREKMELMKEMFQLHQMELEIQRQGECSHHNH
ncbi:hypothetical protein R1flu_004196 [Riccia fluitans]|uniref:Uncharacterized protein n=1 Tax=Riccia fluitans TaxID=41844 RepID=A0ABD1YPL5_9MARC